METVNMVEDEDLSICAESVDNQRRYFKTGETRTLEFRKKQLKKLSKMIIDHEDEILQALATDLGRDTFSAFGAEIGVVKAEIRYVLRKLGKWNRARRISPGLINFGSSARIQAQPKGVCLIVSAYNYPVLLTLLPLVYNIAAGNTAIIKPSEFSTASSKVIKSVIASTFDPEYITVVEGGVDIATELLEQHYDQIIFTGSQRIGKIYAEVAGRKLTPIILELGGKSPTIVHHDTNLKVAAKRILFGKFLNAGQTCVAPDYLLVHEEIADEFIELLKTHMSEMYGGKENPAYSKIINRNQVIRLQEMLEEVGDLTVTGGTIDIERNYIEPTLVEGKYEDLEDKLIMNTEIFGPLLPVIRYETMEELHRIISKNADPLAMYIYTRDKNLVKDIQNTHRVGDICINESVFHFAGSGFPVGGVGSSGYSSYRGQYGFEQLSYMQTVLKQNTIIDFFIRYPPYTKLKENILRMILR